MPPSFPLCIVNRALISKRWLNIESRAAVLLENLHGVNFFICKKAKRRKFGTMASMHDCQASIEEYFCIVILPCVKAAHLI